jgi:hypothetical protein
MSETSRQGISAGRFSLSNIVDHKQLGDQSLCYDDTDEI